MFENLRRLCDDAYRAQDSGLSVGLPRVNVDASQLKHLLDHYDAAQTQLAEARRLLALSTWGDPTGSADPADEMADWSRRRDALLKSLAGGSE